MAWGVVANDDMANISAALGQGVASALFSQADAWARQGGNGNQVFTVQGHDFEVTKVDGTVTRVERSS